MADINTIKEKVKELLDSNANAALKESAKKWLDAADESCGDEFRGELVNQLKEGVATLDDVIYIFGTPEMRSRFGEEAADQIKNHAVDLKAQGEKYCDCPACTKAKEILSELGEELA